MAHLIARLARFSALLGEAVLTALILLTCASVAGRAINTLLHGPIETVAPDFAARALALGIGPINGDFEIVEAGVAFAIFAFLPICHLNSGHAVVDIFTARLPARAKRILSAVIECIFAAVLILITVQLLDGTLSKFRYGETTFLLQFPVWWGYAASLGAAVVACATGVYMAGARVAELVSDRPHASDAQGANH